MSESNFEQVFICGDYLPPYSSIQAVMLRIGKGKVSLSDDEIAKAKQLFCDLSNIYTDLISRSVCPDEYRSKVIDGDLESLQLIELDRRWLSLLKTQAGLVERDFNIIVQCLFMLEWYRLILGDMGVINLNLIAEETSKMLNVYNRKKPLDKYRPNWKLKNYSQHLMIYPDFASAYDYFSDFSLLVLENIGYQLEASDSAGTHRGITLLREIQTEMSAIDLIRIRSRKAYPNETFAGFCSNCMTNYFYERGASSLCSRSECAKAYSAQTSRKNRSITPVGEKKMGYCQGKNCLGSKKRMLVGGICSVCRTQK